MANLSYFLAPKQALSIARESTDRSGGVLWDHHPVDFVLMIHSFYQHVIVWSIDMRDQLIMFLTHDRNKDEN